MARSLFESRERSVEIPYASRRPPLPGDEANLENTDPWWKTVLLYVATCAAILMGFLGLIVAAIILLWRR